MIVSKGFFFQQTIENRMINALFIRFFITRFIKLFTTEKNKIIYDSEVQLHGTKRQREMDHSVSIFQSSIFFSYNKNWSKTDNHSISVCCLPGFIKMFKKSYKKKNKASEPQLATLVRARAGKSCLSALHVIGLTVPAEPLNAESIFENSADLKIARCARQIVAVVNIFFPSPTPSPGSSSSYATAQGEEDSHRPSSGASERPEDGDLERSWLLTFLK